MKQSDTDILKNADIFEQSGKFLTPKGLVVDGKAYSFHFLL